MHVAQSSYELRVVAIVYRAHVGVAGGEVGFRAAGEEDDFVTVGFLLWQEDFEHR